MENENIKIALAMLKEYDMAQPMPTEFHEGTIGTAIDILEKEKEIDILTVVTYNDCHGNGDNRSVMCITNDFERWLEDHNSTRVADGNEPENKEEFDLVSFMPKIYHKEE